MMLAILMTLVPGMILLRGAIADEMDAQRAAAEQAAWCARNPAVGPPTCDERGPLPGYDCREVELNTWVCTPTMSPVAPTPTVPLSAPTPTPVPTPTAVTPPPTVSPAIGI